MRKELLDRVEFCCPVCSWANGSPVPLELITESERAGDVISGHFRCVECPRRYPVIEGVAVLDPEPLRITYDRPNFLQAYLWTHFADLSPAPLDDNAPPQGDYFEALASTPASGFALDLGCNVGRTTFDLGRNADYVLGVERSFEAVKRAREIHRSGRVAFHLKDEGDRGRYVDLDASDVVRPNVEFICGDAAALPLGPDLADTILAANLIDRLRDPKLFLHRTGRILKPSGAISLSAPFTWREDTTPREKWLGGAKDSASRELLSWLGDHGLTVIETRELSLTIRNHNRFFELIRPILIRARKDKG